MEIARYYWLMHGPGWSLPMLAQEFGNLWRVRPTEVLTEPQRNALLARFAELGTSNGQDWFLTRQRLERYADMLPSKDRRLRESVSWVSYSGRVTLTQQPDGMEEFYEEFVRAGHAPTVEEAILRFSAVCKTMFVRLAHERKPVDLGFAVLEPLPTRPNWLEYIRSRLRGSVKEFRRDNGMTPQWRWLLAHIRKIWFAHPHLFMYDKRHRILLWSINLRHKRDWWRTIITTEKLRRRHSRFWYFIRAFEFMAARRERIMPFINDYCTQTRKACLHFRFSFSTGRYCPSRDGQHKHKICDPQEFGAPHSVDLRNWQKVPPFAVAGTAKEVSEMRSFQPPLPNVRDNVEKPADAPVGTDGPNGVRLLDACQSPDA